MANVSRKGLHLDFDRLAQLGYADPSFPVARSSAGIVEDVYGNLSMKAEDTPRFVKGKYAYWVHIRRGLLVEGQRTNIVPNSTGNMSWTLASGAVVTPNAGTAPDGTNTATLIDLTNCAVGAGCYMSVSAVNGARYTTSVFTKSFSATGNANWADPSYAPNWDTQSLPVLDRWARQFVVGAGAGNGSTGFWFKKTAFDVNKFYIWGLQIERGAFPSSLIPTSGAAATRASDILGHNGNPAFDFGFKNESGTVIVDFSPNPMSLSQGNGADAADSCYFKLGIAGGYPVPGINIFNYNGNAEGVKHPVVCVGYGVYYDIFSRYIDWLGSAQLPRYRVVISWENTGTSQSTWQLCVNGSAGLTNFVSDSRCPWCEELLIGKGWNGGSGFANAIFHEVKILPVAFPASVCKAFSVIPTGE